jgi:hypothetical protein
VYPILLLCLPNSTKQPKRSPPAFQFGMYSSNLCKLGWLQERMQADHFEEARVAP